MTVLVTGADNKKITSVFIVALILFSMLASVKLVDVVEASTTGDLSITNSSPSQDEFIPAYVATYFEVTIENNHNLVSPVRNIDWYVCLGEKVANICITNSIDSGEIAIANMLPGVNETFVSLDPFYPNGLNETLTVVYQFDELDINPSDDVYTFQINSSLEFSDIQLDYDENIIDNIPSLVERDNKKMFNNNTIYTIPFSGSANLCNTCLVNATVGWQLWNHNQSEMLKESYQYSTNFPAFSFYRTFTMNLPNFSYEEDGEFVLVYGIFNSTGNPHGDMYEDNNLHNTQIIINSDMNIEINSLSPSHNPSSTTYYYGIDMVTVTLKNSGNNTAMNFSLELIINSDLGNIQSCYITTLSPEQQRSCSFNMPVEGESVELEARLPAQFMGINDFAPNNNILQETANVIVPQISSSIDIENQKEWYTDNELVSVNAITNPFAAAPVNISWWYSGIINIGHGNNIQINTSNYGLGSHNFKMIASDSFGNSESIYFNLFVYREIEIENLPYYDASAITPSNNVEIIHQSTYPAPYETFNIGSGKSPLLLVGFDLLDLTNNQSAFEGQNWIDTNLYLNDLLPSNINLNSIEVRKLNSFEDTNWEYFNSEHYSYNSNSELTVRIFEPTVILLVGTIGEPNVEARNFTTSLISNGNFLLTWDPVGETDSVYNLGWNIYQRLVPDFGGTVFPSPNEEFDEVLWNDLTDNTFRAFVTIEESSWTDLQAIPDGFCASYAVVPVDRKGDTYNRLANVTMDSTGNSTFICGDSTPPSTSIIQLEHSWEFTNDSDCFNTLKDWNICYEITLSWIWPDGENDETWNLYRIEQNPNGIDLTLISPILSNIEYNAGENYSYTQNGIDDEQIRPMKTFYYILTPIDEFGNERTVAIYPSVNVERVHIEDDWWTYNQHLIPEPEPEPEPPLGNDWLGDFSDNMEQQEFKTAGLVTLIILCLGIIMLALISKRLKRLRKVISARKRRQAADSMANEFDDFFE
jgi:hypothetical protein